MLAQWILNTIDSSLRKTIPYFEEAHPLWAVRQRRFDVGSGTRKQQLKAVLAACKQTAGMSIDEYFGKLQPLWDELATYDPIPSCGCGLCICDLGEKFQQKQENHKLHEFLCGIYVDRFKALRSFLLSQDPPPTLDRAYHAMLQEEQLLSHRGLSLDRDNVMAMAVNSPSRVAMTYPLFFPDWWGDRPRGSEIGAGSKLSGQGRPWGQAIGAAGGRGRDTALACVGQYCRGFFWLGWSVSSKCGWLVQLRLE
ncbi:hypothetical protein LIER_24093 [Lithospermum erythrorhizon]|uniref:Retrotransposon gag domain-containing protein n=1 Tax=Lithospermum erythrorhizon TaxID=34254 RepID=A0AAV3R128_LITER